MRSWRFEYRLDLQFDRPIERHTFLFRFLPRSDSRQQVWGVDTACSLSSALPMQPDAFGNTTACCYIAAPHDRLVMTVQGRALMQGTPLRAACPAYYSYSSRLTQPDAAIAALAEDLPGDPVGAALCLTERLREKMVYRKGVTGEFTPAAEALQGGAGVCQDMAHVLLAALRVKHIPCRYAAGLIPGEGETHAWVEVYDGHAFVGVDPTHMRLTDDTYLFVNSGRDSADCAINRGVFTGQAGQTLSVLAEMTEK